MRWYIKLHEPLYTQIRLEWLVVTGKVTAYQLRFSSIHKERWSLDRLFHTKNSLFKPRGHKSHDFPQLALPCRTISEEYIVHLMLSIYPEYLDSIKHRIVK